MKISSYTAVYSLTLLLSAALLFSIQPIFSKMILPLLGGAPHVWNTAMVFFQVTLLAGYAYAHATTRLLGVRWQAILHIILLLLFACALPFAIEESIRPPVDHDPTLWQLLLMITVIGGPFFVLSGSAPMLQRWFSETDHPDAGNPYFLYGASNLGSMTALLSYPILIEPFLTLNMQSIFWTYGYIALIGLSVVSAAMVWAHIKKRPVSHDPMFDANAINWRQRGWWLLMAFLPSSLMLGVTTYMTTDITSAPLLWILPLAIYVGTFILVFARKPVLSLQHITVAFSASLAVLLAITVAWGNMNAVPLIALHLIVFFFAAMLCHTELANSRPKPSHLTEFYLIMSVGGALGGILNALIAPQIFLIPLEYTIVLMAIIFLRYHAQDGLGIRSGLRLFRTRFKQEGSALLFELPALSLLGIIILGTSLSHVPGKITSPIAALLLLVGLALLYRTRWTFNLACLTLLLLFPLGFNWKISHDQDVIHMDRNFFGVIRVVNLGDKERTFIHGTTTHGTQAQIEEYKLTPLSYYSQFSPINNIYDYLDRQDGPQRIAVLGLGVGVTACFSKNGRHYTFFEIDPDVAAIAGNEEYFTFLSDCDSPYHIKLGDARLTMRNEPDGTYNMIFADAYSSDNIPAHLITLEALQIYTEKLKKNGLLLFNISNRHLDMEPVLHEAGREMELYTITKASEGSKIEGANIHVYPAQYVLMTQNKGLVDHLKAADGWADTRAREGVRLWTDNYSNIFRVLGNKSGTRRIEEARKAKKAKSRSE